MPACNAVDISSSVRTHAKAMHPQVQMLEVLFRCAVMPGVVSVSFFLFPSSQSRHKRWRETFSPFYLLSDCKCKFKKATFPNPAERGEPSCGKQSPGRRAPSWKARHLDSKADFYPHSSIEVGFFSNVLIAYVKCNFFSPTTVQPFCWTTINIRVLRCRFIFSPCP